MLRKLLFPLLCIALCAALILPSFSAPRALAEGEYRTLKEGDSGQDVLNLKKRMYQLGYFSNNKNLSSDFNRTMAERIRLLERANGLEETGIATPELQQLIYSDACVWTGTTPKPTAVPTATPAPRGPEKAPVMPECDENGFLADADAAPFVYADRDDGLWIYKSRSISVEIRRYQTKEPKLIWLETYIRVQNGAKLESLLTAGKTPGYAFDSPRTIYSGSGAVVAFSDDFYGYRHRYNGGIEGVIIRDGRVICEKTKRAEVYSWPPLDIMAVWPDGSMKTFDSDQYTAQEYLDMGVTDTYAFGPILVKDGRVNDEDLYTWSTTDMDPRTALGMLEPGSYCVLTVLGRRSDSKGCTIQQTAQMIRNMGAREALMLDGGNTTCLIFMGDIINRDANVKEKDIRQVSGLIGVKEADGQ